MMMVAVLMMTVMAMVTVNEAAVGRRDLRNRSLQVGCVLAVSSLMGP
jgi:hypothetical protein